VVIIGFCHQTSGVNLIVFFATPTETPVVCVQCLNLQISDWISSQAAVS